MLTRVSILVLFLTVLAIGVMPAEQARAQSVSSEDLGPLANTQSTATESTTTTVARTISNRVAQALRIITNRRPGAIRASATETIAGAQDGGSFFDNAGVWGNASHEHIREEPVDFTQTTRQIVGISGGDKFVTDNVLLGVAIAGSKTHAESEGFRIGVTPNIDVKTRSLGTTFYGAWIVNPSFYLDATAGYSREEHNTRSRNGNGPLNNNFDQRGYTWSASVNGYVTEPIGDTMAITGQLGVLRTLTTVDDTIDPLSVAGNNSVPGSKTNLTQYTLGGELSYAFRDDVVFYGGAAIEVFGKSQEVGLGEGVAGPSGTDRQDQHRWQARFRFGSDVYSGDHMTVSAEGGFVAFRDNTENWTVGLNARYDF